MSFYYNINAPTPPAMLTTEAQRERKSFGHGFSRMKTDRWKSIKGKRGDPCLCVKNPWLAESPRLLLLRRRRGGRSGKLLGLWSLRFRFCLMRLGRWLRLRWSQNQVQRVAFLTWPEFHNRLVAKVGDQSVQNPASQALACHLASAEEDGRLHLVAFGEEAQHVVLLGLVVVIVHVDAELHFLDRDLVLVFLGLALALFLLVQVLPVIHDAAHGRLSVGRDFYQVEGFFAGNLERFVGRHDAKLVAFIVDHAKFTCANTLVGADETFVDTAPQVTAVLSKYCTGISGSFLVIRRSRCGIIRAYGRIHQLVWSEEWVGGRGPARLVTPDYQFDKAVAIFCRHGKGSAMEPGNCFEARINSGWHYLPDPNQSSF